MMQVPKEKTGERVLKCSKSYPLPNIHGGEGTGQLSIGKTLEGELLSSPFLSF